MRRLLPGLFALLLGLIANASLAQSPPPAAVIDAAGREIEAIDKGFGQPDLTDEALTAYRARLETLRGELGELANGLTKRREEADRRLKEIGPPPAEGATEAPEVARDRDSESKAKQAVEAEEKQARLLLVRAEQAVETVTRTRRALFTARIFDRSYSILDPDLWLEATQGLSRAGSATRVFFAPAVAAWDRASVFDFALLAGALLLAVLIAWPLRRLLEYGAFRLVHWRVGDPQFRRSALAFASTLICAGAPFLAALVVGLALQAAGLLPGAIGELALRFLLLVGFVAFAFALGRALLSPDRPGLRLAPVGPEAAHALRWYPLAIAGIFAVGKFVEAVNATLAVPLATTILLSALFSVATALLFAGALRTIRPRPDAEDAGKERFLLALLRMAAWLVIFVVFGAILAGYVKLASFLVDQLVWAAMVGAVTLLLLQLVDDALMAWARPAGIFGRFATGTVGIGGSAIERIAVVLSGALRAMLLVAAAVLVAAPWGLQSTDVFAALRAAVVGFRVGGITISIGEILAALAVFLVGYVATRTVQSWLDNRFLPRTSLDSGLKASIGTAIGYAGIILAGLAALASLGFGLDRIALLAGALSLGIGFGLQSIVNNFVSGIILLAERPIKPGDWIAIGSDEGNVQRISVRATEIALFDGSTLIVPNADFISKPVRNVTLRGVQGRVKLDFGTAYGTDPERVRGIALEAAADHAEVLRAPSPTVLLTGFRDVGMSFSLICYVASQRAVASVRSDLAFAVVRGCQAAGLEMR